MWKNMVGSDRLQLQYNGGQKGCDLHSG
jgi:hypothetical protein